jgi:two-component system chemotaxis response regulator CheV
MSIETNILLQSGTNELEVVEFALNFTGKNGVVQTQSFGINVAKVREIIRMPALTKMPNLPECVYGVFNLRNSLISALDLSKYLYSSENNDPNRKMIISEFNKIRCGFIVNDVHRIHRISWSQIESPEAFQDFDESNSTVIGIIKKDDRTILMLDVEKIIADIDPTSALDKVSDNISATGPLKAITAEDSTTIRKLITERLKIAGYEIESYQNGEDAWNRLAEISKKTAQGETLSDMVNVVITDIEMPKMDGYTLTKNIKSDPVLQKLPVVIFSSIVSADVLHKGRSVGADVQLTKPQIGELLEVLRALVK